ncbi:Ferritin heavy chain B [Paragonimus heterotremus]|uniref:Ferritin n=1 Tax=Paragonimus heterotremus TaxID=100268 RepID=A0A8J4SEH2_9TREM|nr:Ferritin heavy chain B [Paragonimus heterotremus]
MESLARQNFARECEAAINRQINMELEASYAYFAFANYLEQDTVAQPNAAKFFREQSHEEREHAEKLAHYQNLRGGRVAYQDVKKPPKTTFASLQEVMEVALQMEKSVNEVRHNQNFSSFNASEVTRFVTPTIAFRCKLTKRPRPGRFHRDRISSGTGEIYQAVCRLRDTVEAKWSEPG